MTEHYPLYPDLRGKTAVVTGGSKGIGESTCRAFAQNGVKVAVVARGNETIERVVEELRSLGAEAIGVVADCTSRSDLQRVRNEVESVLGPADIVVAFAGGFTRATPILEIGDEEWQFVIESNLTSTFLTTQVFLAGMIERRRGAFVTMSSNAGRLLDITLTASYAAAKAGIVMFTRHVAKEVGPSGVRLNCVAPATTLTERVKGVLNEERRKEVVQLAPLRKIGEPSDTANATLYLCSDAAGWITGVTLDIAGGRIML